MHIKLTLCCGKTKSLMHWANLVAQMVGKEKNP